ncbi:hypothetical protein AMK59_6417 [Oryctes borbonicus]|uniref:Centriolar and ciliogenesis-associated protein HYLS1 C-terminal domain-containing protein n=1 Tax=Oryctes borbonicus TaxID=1629725 RepID=A0A0T6AXV4_9SCAR|nr:hypothetical protein AMK59_6417 [Oryctes borbonicus]
MSMSCVINPRDVLEYLNELGYQNITADQLKEFIRDLKKLIKYDQRIEEEEKENIENVQPQRKQREEDIFASLYDTGTASSKAKEIPKKEKIISVQIKRPITGKCMQHKSSSKVDMLPHSSRSTNEMSYSGYSNEYTGSIDKKTNEIVERPLSQKTKSGANVDRISTQTIKVKASFIRPRLPVKPCKSDPVALYHQYQAEWKRQKIPGENNHSNLRWVIREKMLGNPEIVPKTSSMDRLRSKKLYNRV